jgi:hypothetical protein
MYTEILRGIEGIGIFPVISLVMFVTVFTVMLVRVARTDRERLARHAALPLSDSAPVSVDDFEDSMSRRQV